MTIPARLTAAALAAVALTACDPNSRHHSITCDTFTDPQTIQCVDGATGHLVLAFPSDLDLHGAEDGVTFDVRPDPNDPGEKTIVITWAAP